MSFDINWDRLTSDNEINDSIKEWLDSQFKSISLPSYISNLAVTDFSLGDQPPEIVIRHVGDPFDDFYEEDDEEDSKVKNANGIQVPAPAAEADVEEEEEARKLPNDEEDEDEDEQTPEISTTIGDDLQALKLNLSSSEQSANSSFAPPSPPSPPTLERLRTSSDSISLIMGNNNLNYLHNYGTNSIIGLGPSTHSDSPISSLRASKLRSRSKSNSPTTVLDSPETPPASTVPPTSDTVDDIQFIMELGYAGNIRLEVTVNLLVNYPSPNFISLPIKLHITELNIHSVVAVAYLKKRVYFSFLCDINDSASDYFTSGGVPPNPSVASTPPPINTGGNFVDYISGTNNRERIDIIKKIRIESEIGEVENNVLRNVGKVERFVVDQLRSIIRDEVAWPGWVCLDMSDNENDEDDESIV